VGELRNRRKASSLVWKWIFALQDILRELRNLFLFHSDEPSGAAFGAEIVLLSMQSRQRFEPHKFDFVTVQFHLEPVVVPYKTGTTGTLASQAEIGVWVQAPEHFYAGLRGSTP